MLEILTIRSLFFKCRKASFFLIPAVLGYISFIFPYILTEGFMAVILNPLILFQEEPGIAGSFYLTILGLFITGFILSIVKPRKWLFIGISAIVLIPLLVVIDTIINPTSHNLWFFEFFMYGLMDMAAISGALLARRIRMGGSQSFESSYLRKKR